MERGSKRKFKELETFLLNPPEVILTFDNYRGRDEKSEDLAYKTMRVRAAVAATVFHSPIYDEIDEPFMCSFAGEHFEGGRAGSKKVVDNLEDFLVPFDKLILRQNTITTNTDLMQLHALMSARNFRTAAIVTTDDHVARTKLEIGNHFRRGEKHKNKPLLYVLSPSSHIVDWLQHNTENNQFVSDEIEPWLQLGRTKLLGGGPTETIATSIARIPFRSLRLPIQKLAERVNHSHTPVKLARIQKMIP